MWKTFFEKQKIIRKLAFLGFFHHRIYVGFLWKSENCEENFYILKFIFSLQIMWFWTLRYGDLSHIFVWERRIRRPRKLVGLVKKIGICLGRKIRFGKQWPRTSQPMGTHRGRRIHKKRGFLYRLGWDRWMKKNLPGTKHRIGNASVTTRSHSRAANLTASCFPLLILLVYKTFLHSFAS